MSVRKILRSLHAATALLLMVLFFASAAAAGLGLIFAGWELGGGVLNQVRGRGMIVLGLICLALIGAGVVVLWSILPRIDRFEPPGPELLPGEHPLLFRQIKRVAAVTGQREPAQVYLVGDVNAFVAERGGLMGIGGQRVMGIGLPMLSVLTVSELRAVLTHEFGHFVGGDTRLGKWIFKTRAALARTLNNLANAGNASDVSEVAIVFVVVHAPFRWFFAFYMRFTQALSRSQEFDADALAVRLEGTSAFVDGMKKVDRAALGYAAYVRNELAPILRRGFMPPLAAGFSQFMSAEKIDIALTRVAERSLVETEADPYDSHPPARDRIAAAQRLAVTAGSRDDRPAIELLGQVSALELAVARRWVDDTVLAPITWEKANAPLEAHWKEAARDLAPHLLGVTLRSLSREPAALRELASRQHGENALHLSDEDAVSWATNTFTALVFAMLLQQGFASVNRPGHAPTFVRREESFQPSDAVAGFFDGTLAQSEWHAQLEAMSVADRDLSLVTG